MNDCAKDVARALAISWGWDDAAQGEIRRDGQLFELCSEKDRRQQSGGSMNVTAGFAAVVIVAGAAVGFAGPAQAAGDFSGTFIPNGPGLSSTWVVTPCGPDCAHIADSGGWSADAHPFGGLWRFVVDLPDGTKCNNDGIAPGTVTFKVDATRQDGTMLTTNPATGCQWGLAPGYSQPVYFSLTRI